MHVLKPSEGRNLDSRQNVRVTSVQNGHGTNSEQLTADGTQLVVTALEVVDLGLGQHGVVLQLRLSQDWGVTSNDNQLGLAGSQSLNGRLVTQGVLTGFDNQTQLGVDVLSSLVLWGLMMLVFFNSDARRFQGSFELFSLRPNQPPKCILTISVIYLNTPVDEEEEDV